MSDGLLVYRMGDGVRMCDACSLPIITLRGAPSTVMRWDEGRRGACRSSAMLRHCCVRVEVRPRYGGHGWAAGTRVCRASATTRVEVEDDIRRRIIDAWTRATTNQLNDLVETLPGKVS